MPQPPETVKVAMSGNPRLEYRIMNKSDYEAMPEAKRPKLFGEKKAAEPKPKAKGK